MLALVPYLQGNDGVPVREVAREFGVTPKQIRDDLRLLMFTGVGEYAGELIDVDLAALEVDDVIHIRDAEFLSRPLRLTADEGVAPRQVDPQRLFTRQGHTYLEAYCLRADDVRFFRLDRVVRADDTGRRAQRHDATSRDLGDDLFEVGEQTPSAVLDLDPAAHWLTEYYTVEELGDVAGRRRVRLYGGDEAWLRRLVLRNGGTVHVVEPDALRVQVLDTARSALAAYDG